MSEQTPREALRNLAGVIIDEAVKDFERVKRMIVWRCNVNTMCDACGRAISLDEANDVEGGEWDGATLCNDCYAEKVVFAD